MLNYKKIIWSLILFAVGILIINYGIDDTAEGLKAKKTYSAKKNEQINALVTEASSDVICVVLIMPKSYQAALERFSHRKIARDIKILPANYQWSDEKLIFLPKQIIWKEKGRPISTRQVSHRQPTGHSSTSSAGKEKIILGAAFLQLLAKAKSGLIR
jgi:hypothetical protein